MTIPDPESISSQYVRGTGNAYSVIISSNLLLNDHGRIVTEEWYRSRSIRQEIELDEFIVMPNHVHGIVLIHADDISTKAGANGRSPRQMKPRSLSSFIAGFKSSVTKRVNELRMTPGQPVWQRNYYEHIVRNEKEMDHIREYIRNNPMQWEIDENNPEKKSQVEGS